MAEISLHAGAEIDFEVSLAWYLSRSARAAQRFELAFEEALASIAANPELNAKCDECHRCCRLRRYPFSIVYRVDGERISVVAVAHASRRPDYSSGRD